MSAPKIAALITASGGIGSHLILHKLHGHENLVALKESAFASQGGTTKGDLKRHLSQGVFLSSQINNEQLLPKKNVNNTEWLILNKPPLKRMVYHQNFHPETPLLYIFRNPVSFYYTWVKKWGEYGDKRYNRRVEDSTVFNWFKTTFLTSLFELSQVYNPDRDCIISFEHFMFNIDNELSRCFKTLGVTEKSNKDLETLKKCPHCSTDLGVKKLSIRSGRVEDVLFCPNHGKILGPGEYNYIRKENPSFLNKWKKKTDSKVMSKEFSKLFGEEFIKYYSEEEYLQDLDRNRFDSLIKKLLDGLKI